MKHLILLIVTALSLITGSIASAENRVTYIHTDALGSPIAGTNKDGRTLWYQDYRPYGDQYYNAQRAKNHDYWYAGHNHDVETGLIDMGARFYDPFVGRFMAIDPVGVRTHEPKQFNRYAYANNNPYKYVDPNGEIAFLIPVAVFLAKELAAEGLSQATGGLSDWFSVRRVGTKAVKGTFKAVDRLTRLRGEPNYKSAEDAADVAIARGKTSGAAVELKINGKTFTAISGESTPDNSKVIGALMGSKVPNKSKNLPGHHGACGEIICINKALNAGVDPAGGTIRAVNIGAQYGKHKASKKLCVSCRDTTKHFKVSE